MFSRLVTIDDGKQVVRLAPVDLQEAQRIKERTRRSKWDMQHMGTVSTRLRIEAVKAYKSHCKALGTTPYARVRELIKRDMGSLEWSPRDDTPPGVRPSARAYYPVQVNDDP